MWKWNKMCRKVRTDKTTVNVETLAGIKILKLNVGDDGKVASVVVNMGKPELEASKVPVDVNALVEYKAAYRNTYKNDASLCPLAVKALDNVENAVINEAILVDGKSYDITGVSMGNPHDIVYLDNDIDITKFDIEKVGPYFENHKAFPERINTEFVQVLDRKTLNMRVWERGSGETFACGTGTCATVVATVLNGMCDSKDVTVHLLGGDLKITWDEESGDVYMEGPAATVFTGEIEL